MKLKEFLDTMKMSQAEFANIAGLTSACINNLLKGKRKNSSLTTAARIAIATNFQVMPFDMLTQKEISAMNKSIGRRIEKYNKTLKARELNDSTKASN